MARARLSLTACIVLVATQSLAAPRRIEECETISAPLAYNECLASFGPTRANRGASRNYAPAEEPRRAARNQSRSLPGVAVTRKSNGRIHMEFTPR